MTSLIVLGVLLLIILMARLGLHSLSANNDLSGVLGSVVQLALAMSTLVLVTYVVMYFLALVGGFYESLTCKVVTLPACEDPLALPSWLRLPAQSVGGVIGILPLLGIYLAKVLQSKTLPTQTLESLPWYGQLMQQMGHWFMQNAGMVFVLVIEIWLAFLRGSAEAADRQVRIALGLDQELPTIYLTVAQWGAVVLALGLSVVVIYLGMIGRYARLLLVSSLSRLEYGAALVTPLVHFFHQLAQGLIDIWKVVAITLGRLLLKLQSILYRLWVVAVSSLGRFLLKSQSFLYRLWMLVATTLGWLLLGVRSIFSRGKGTLEAVLFILAIGGGSYSYAATYVVLFDATGSERGRLDDTQQQVLGWADPSPERALLARGDRLIIIPIRAPGNLDTTYSALFNATYPSSQLDRYAFFTELRDALPEDVDRDDGTGLSDSLRATKLYLEDAPDQRILIVFGNGEDHSANPISPLDMGQALQGATVVHLNVGLEGREKWEAFYSQAGANKLLFYDLAATRSLRQLELKEALE